MYKQLSWLAALLCIFSLSSCAVWETITFSEEPRSEIETRQKQVIDLQYVWDKSSKGNLVKELPKSLKDDTSFGGALNGCFQTKTNPALILIPVAVKFLVDTALDATAKYAEDLQDRGIQMYPASLVISDTKGNEPIKQGVLGGAAPEDSAERGCLVMVRKGSGPEGQVGMAAIIQLVGYKKIMRFVPTYVRFDNAMALTRKGDGKVPSQIDANFAIVISASRAIKLGDGSKKVELGLSTFDIKGAPLGTAAIDCSVTDNEDKCPIATKTIDQADESAQDIEFSVSVTEMGSQVKDAKKAQEKFNSFKETIGPKVEEFLKGQLKNDSK